jgi:hypothetical protein
MPSTNRKIQTNATMLIPSGTMTKKPVTNLRRSHCNIFLRSAPLAGLMRTTVCSQSA